MRLTCGLAAAALLVTVAGCSGDSDSDSGSGTSATATASATVTTAPVVAPYVDIVSGTADITAIHTATGQADFTAAFVLADSAKTCTPTWGGTAAIDDSTIAAAIAKITAISGDVIVSTGGETGTYLENVCSADELAAAYEKALDVAGSNYLDVDIEQTVTAATIMTALSTVQKARGTAITLTLPVGGESVGLTDTAIALLQSAEDAGLDVTVNAMIMNFTGTGSDWGAALTTATESVKADVAGVWSDLTDTEVYAMLGVTPMIGANGLGGPTTVANAKTLLTYAKEKGLGFVRFWSVNRDNGDCTDGSVSSKCSGISQTDYAFTDLFADYTG
ncbi:glycosyl hydrolase [Paractinoplanes toevensis]|uniref:Sugar hydrolase n=1 Tax=Paractinoplanes toevensis TaxID=571911 RepID=A0A919TFX9_9ACTN|nr:glycosyl hydrolase [Actinoplanes toevensis]GIM94627.1 sugar hydrolase [Actinoplanes toevensis]